MIMKLGILPPAAHAVMDYALGATALAAPNLLGFTNRSTPTWLTRGLGIYSLVTALTTRNKGGLVNGMSHGRHLNLDLLGNGLLFAAPWLLGFSKDKKAMRTVLALAAVQGVVWLLSRRR